MKTNIYKELWEPLVKDDMGMWRVIVDIGGKKQYKGPVSVIIDGLIG